MAEESKPKTAHHGFKKGQSGNPKGRPLGVPNKNTVELRALAGQFTEEAVKGLVTIARDVEQPTQARVSAWKEILDRGHGKSPQAVTVSGDPDGVPVRQVIHQYITEADAAARH